MIVHVTDVFAPRLGGIEVQVAGLAAAQHATGERVCVLTGTPGGPGDHEYPVHRTGLGKATRLLAQLRPSVVHVHLSVVSPLCWAAIHWASRAQVAIVVTVHSLWDRPTQLGYRLLARLARQGGWPVVTAVSDSARRHVQAAIPCPHAITIPNGVALAHWRTTSPIRQHTNEVHVVAIGRLAPRRRPIELLDILRRAQHRLGPRITLRTTIAGTGPLRPAMIAYLHRHRMTGRVHLAGRLDPAHLTDLLGTADVLLNPVRREAFGIATLEARTAGVPVIALRDTGVADFVRHGVEGLLCANTDDMVDSLVTLARDPDLRHRIATHNRTTTPIQFDWPAVLAQLGECYARASALTTADHR